MIEIKVCIFMGNMVEEGIPGMKKVRQVVKYVAHVDVEPTKNRKSCQEWGRNRSQ